MRIAYDRKTLFILLSVFLSFLSKGLPAQESGLLLGLRSSKPNVAPDAPDMETSSYRTLWIAPQGGKVAVIVEKEGIYIPRKSGFWRLDVVTQQTPKDYWEDTLAAASIAKKPYLRPIDSEVAKSCEGREVYTLLFVGNDYVAADHSSWADCGGAHPSASNHLWVLSIDKIANRAFPDLNRAEVKTSKLLGAKGEQALKQGCDLSSEDGCPEDLAMSWAPVRNQGRWKLQGRWACNWGACRGTHEEFDVPLVPPASLVGDDRLSPDFLTIKKFVPEAMDAFSSPKGDLMAVLSANEIQVFTPKAGILGKPVLKLPLKPKEAAVMAQWATGKNVSHWSKTLVSAPSSLNPKEELNQSFQALQNLKSYRLEIESTTDPSQGHTTVDFVAPDRYHLNSAPILSGKPLQMETILIGSKVYMKMGGGPLWWKLPKAADLTQANLIMESIKQSTQVQFLGNKLLDGQPMKVYRYRYRVTTPSGNKVKSIGKAWISPTDRLPRRIEIADHYETGSRSRMTTRLSNFNADLRIEPPIFSLPIPM